MERGLKTRAGEGVRKECRYRGYGIKLDTVEGRKEDKVVRGFLSSSSIIIITRLFVRFALLSPPLFVHMSTDG